MADHDLGDVVYKFRLSRQLFLQDLQQIESDAMATAERIRAKFASIGVSGAGRSSGASSPSGLPTSASESGIGSALIGAGVAGAIDTANNNNLINSLRGTMGTPVSSAVANSVFKNFPPIVGTLPSSAAQPMVPNTSTLVNTPQIAKVISTQMHNVVNDMTAKEGSPEYYKEIRRRNQQVSDDGRSSVGNIGPNMTGGNGGQFAGAFAGGGGAGGGGGINAGGGNAWAAGPTGGASGGQPSAIWAALAKKFAPAVVAYMGLKVAESISTFQTDYSAAGSNPYGKQMAQNNFGRDLISSVPFIGAPIANMVFHSRDVEAGFAESDRVQTLNYGNSQRLMPVLSANAKASAFGGLSVASSYAASNNALKAKTAELDGKIAAQEFENRTKKIDMNGAVDEQLSLRGITIKYNGEPMAEYDKKLRDAAEKYNFDLYHDTVAPLTFQKEYAVAQSRNEKQLILDQSTAQIGAVTAQNQGAQYSNRLMPFSGMAVANSGTLAAQYTLFKSQINQPGMDDAARDKEKQLMAASITSSILALQGGQAQLGMNLGYGRPSEFDPRFQSIEANRDISPETTAIAMTRLAEAIEANNKLLDDLKSMK